MKWIVIHLEFLTQVDSQIKFKTTNLIQVYGDAYILAKRTKASFGDLGAETSAEQEAQWAAERNKKPVIIKNFSPFTDCRS